MYDYMNLNDDESYTFLVVFIESIVLSFIVYYTIYSIIYFLYFTFNKLNNYDDNVSDDEKEEEVEEVVYEEYSSSDEDYKEEESDDNINNNNNKMVTCHNRLLSFTIEHYYNTNDGHYFILTHKRMENEYYSMQECFRLINMVCLHCDNAYISYIDDIIEDRPVDPNKLKHSINNTVKNIGNYDNMFYESICNSYVYRVDNGIDMIKFIKNLRKEFNVTVKRSTNFHENISNNNLNMDKEVIVENIIDVFPTKKWSNNTYYSHISMYGTYMSPISTNVLCNDFILHSFTVDVEF